MDKFIPIIYGVKYLSPPSPAKFSYRAWRVPNFPRQQYREIDGFMASVAGLAGNYLSGWL